MAKKTIFIGHPISGDLEKNIRRVLEICSKIHTKNIIPVAPYLISLQYLNDELIEDRKLGMEANHECFYRKYVDELWLFGDRISEGMKKEIALAYELGIPIIAKTADTEKHLKIYFDSLQ
jgi:hypothetical protein